MARVGLRAYLFFVLCVTAIGPLSLFAWNQAEHLAQVGLESADRQSLAVARAVAQQIVVALEGYIRAAETVSAQIATTGMSDRQLIANALVSHVNHHAEFLGAYAADAQGHAIVNAWSDGRTAETNIDYSDRDYVRELLRTRETTISRAAVGRVTNVLSVQIAAPILGDEGDFLGLSCSSIDLSAITEATRRGEEGLQGGRVLILDQDGTKLADSSKPGLVEPQRDASASAYTRQPVGESELRIGLDESKQLVRGTILRLPSPLLHWTVVVTVPQARVHEQSQRMRSAALRFGSVFVACAIALSAWLATMMAKPLHLLSEAATSIAGGNFEADFLLPRNIPRELQHLGSALRAMINTLKGHAERLEGLVAERTQELRQKNAELVDALALLHEKDRRLHADLEQAKLFQETLLPTPATYSGLDIAYHFAPLERVSGDIFDICALGPGCIRIFVADAIGHGVQAAMRTILLKSTYERLKRLHLAPNELLSAFNQALLMQSIGSELQCTASCLDLRPSEAGVDVQLASAGGPPVHVLSVARSPEELFVEGPLLGLSPVELSEVAAFRVASGQVLLVASDGLIEQWNSTHQRFEGVLGQYRVATNQTAQESIQELMRRFDAFRDTTPIGDDLTVVAVRVT
ncbi:MAG TPA: SpoIIE family protein phosphatase [Polyangiaceae bacterium]|nr:SpoIIE family protein phosphatase [Polyangiaceae bacterium]